MKRELDRIDSSLQNLVMLAQELRADPDKHVHRSAQELRAVFAARGAMEPAVARVRRSMELLRSGDFETSRREFQKRARGLDRLRQLVECELLPDLRRLGFDV